MKNKLKFLNFSKKILEKNKLNKKFFLNTALEVGKDLIGKFFYFKGSGGIIIETESYFGDDPASHGSIGKTKRNFAMFCEGGILYVYKIYGMYYCVNIVTDKKDYPSAVLIREILPLIGIKNMIKRREKNNNKNKKNNKIIKEKDLCSGPGKLCISLGIDLSYNLIDITNNSDIFISDIQFNPTKILKLPRIGISKAKDKLYRFRGVFD